MVTGVLDVWVTPEVDPSDMILVTDCMNGYPHELHGIAHGTVVTLSKDGMERSVQVIRESSNECAFHYMELHPQTAKELGLHNGSRCQVSYDEVNMAMKLVPVSVSRSHAAVRIDRRTHRPRRMIIGYSLLSLLGIRKQANSIITIKRNAASAKLRLVIPDNELDESFILPAREAAKLGITQSGTYLLEYNHATRVLRLPENIPDSVPPVEEPSAPAPVRDENRETASATQIRKLAKPGRSAVKRTVRTVRTAASDLGRKQSTPWLHPAVALRKKGAAAVTGNPRPSRLP